MAEPDISIKVDGKPALTITQAAARYGLKRSSMTSELSRMDPPLAPVAQLDGRTPLYQAKHLDAIMAARPGKGSPGRPRVRRQEAGSP